MKSAEAERGSREVQIFPVLMWAVARQKEEKTNEGFKGGRIAAAARWREEQANVALGSSLAKDALHLRSLVPNSRLKISVAISE